MAIMEGKLAVRVRVRVKRLVTNNYYLIPTPCSDR